MKCNAPGILTDLLFAVGSYQILMDHRFDNVGDLDGVHAHTQDGERLGVRGSGFGLEEWQFWISDFMVAPTFRSALRIREVPRSHFKTGYNALVLQ